MMKHEFDALVGIDTDPECYKKIEAVYTQFDEMFPTKEAIASFYKKHDMNGIERMYCEALKIQAVNEQNKQLEQQLKQIRVSEIYVKLYEDISRLIDNVKESELIPMPVKPAERDYQYTFPKWRTQYQQEPINHAIRLSLSEKQLDTMAEALAKASEHGYICPTGIGLQELQDTNCMKTSCEQCWKEALLMGAER